MRVATILLALVACAVAAPSASDASLADAVQLEPGSPESFSAIAHEAANAAEAHAAATDAALKEARRIAAMSPDTVNTVDAVTAAARVAREAAGQANIALKRAEVAFATFGPAAPFQAMNHDATESHGNDTNTNSDANPISNSDRPLASAQDAKSRVAVDVERADRAYKHARQIAILTEDIARKVAEAAAAAENLRLAREQSAAEEQAVADPQTQVQSEEKPEAAQPTKESAKSHKPKPKNKKVTVRSALETIVSVIGLLIAGKLQQSFNVMGNVAQDVGQQAVDAAIGAAAEHVEKAAAPHIDAGRVLVDNAVAGIGNVARPVLNVFGLSKDADQPVQDSARNAAGDQQNSAQSIENVANPAANPPPPAVASADQSNSATIANHAIVPNSNRDLAATGKQSTVNHNPSTSLLFTTEGILNAVKSHCFASYQALMNAYKASEQISVIPDGPITPDQVKLVNRFVQDARLAHLKAIMALHDAKSVYALFQSDMSRRSMFYDVVDRTGRPDLDKIKFEMDVAQKYTQFIVERATLNLQKTDDVVAMVEEIASMMELESNAHHIEMAPKNDVPSASGSAQEHVLVVPIASPVASESDTDAATSDALSNHGDRESDKQGDASATSSTKDDKAPVDGDQSGADGLSPDSTNSGDQTDKSPVESKSVFDVVKRNPIKAAACLALAAAAIWSIRAFIAHRRRRVAMNSTITTNTRTIIPTTISAPPYATVTTNSTKI